MNYYFHQNEEQRQPDLLKMFTIKTEIEQSDYEINEKEKVFNEEEKNNDIGGEVKTFYENDFYNIRNNNIQNKIQFSKEETFVENKKSCINEEEKHIENKDNNGDNNNNAKDKANEAESIVLESDSENPGS